MTLLSLLPRFLTAAVSASLVVSGLLGVAPAAADDSVFAPTDTPGQALRPSPAALADAVTCSGKFDKGKQAVLLVPGSGQTSSAQFSWSWEPALTRAGIPWCAVSPPFSSLGDLSIAGEYDAYAIRRTFALSGRKIAVVGHSQGAMRPRWAFRFFPDTRAMVADFVGVTPINQGLSAHLPAVPLISTACGVAGCPAAAWQGRVGARFMQALNSGQETFPGIDYSVIYSRLDGGVNPVDTPLDPAPGTSYRRVAVQDRCPLRIADHLTNGTVDAVAWAMVVDAITHPGPVDLSRIDANVCGQLLIPGLDPLTAIQGGGNALLHLTSAVASAPRLISEPALPCYVYAHGCG